MSAMDATAERRLARLREHDTIGMYAADRPASGTDASGAVSVTVDPTNRVLSVVVGPLTDALRDPAGLSVAVSAAHRAAILGKLPERGRAEPARRPPRARTPQAAPWRPLDNILESGRPFDPDAHLRSPGGLDAPLKQHTGRSRNECVTVTLDLAAPTGTLDVDPGWLRNATAAHVSTALTESFLDAYRERDARD